MATPFAAQVPIPCDVQLATDTVEPHVRICWQLPGGPPDVPAVQEGASPAASRGPSMPSLISVSLGPSLISASRGPDSFEAESLPDPSLPASLASGMLASSRPLSPLETSLAASEEEEEAAASVPTSGGPLAPSEKPVPPPELPPASIPAAH